MAQLSNRLQRLAPSATLAMSQKSSEMKAQGIDVINMSVGEPDFNTPDHIKQEAKMAIDENYSKYSPVPGYPFLRQAIARKLERENHLHYTPEEILVSNGAKQSVCNTVMALVDDGEEVIIPAPYWVSYPQMVLLAGGKPVFVEAGFDQNFKMTAAQLEAAITPKTRMLILCSPSNPTGSVYSHEELKALADVILAQWRRYTDEEAFIFAATEDVPHNTITPIARRRGENFELDLVLRNNITTDEHPMGVYHPHAEHHHIKRENIGLIEVMGLAILPSRLKNEIALLAEYLKSGKDVSENETIEKHADWVRSLSAKYGDFIMLPNEEVVRILEKEIGLVFCDILCQAGVFKQDEKGISFFERFIEAVNTSL